MTSSEPRLLILGAHPDDAEFHAGGLAAAYRALNREVKMVSVTDGAAGHHTRSPEELITLRKQEAANAGAVIGAAYETWKFPDASLQPTLEVRHRIIREIREFQPSLVLTHRTSDYHPDHRAVGQCVQDASYLVTVPHVVPEVPVLRKDPVVAYMPDLFTRPAPMQPHVILDITQHVDAIVKMLACHRSQVFEWLAYEGGLLETVPTDEEAKIEWLRNWLLQHIRPRALHFKSELKAVFGTDLTSAVELIEAFEISEYAHQPDRRLIEELFPEGRLVEQ